MFRLAVCACLLGIACKSDPASKHETPTPTAPTPAKTEDPCRNAKAEGPLAWIADDYPNALACAKQKKIPLVLDLWAPWCHTCLSMQTTVFVDPAMAANKDKFVFASLDTDKETNAAALAKLSISAWPTFYVVHSADESVLARFVGAATTEQFQDFLDAGARALAGGAAGGDAHLLGAERALALKNYDVAAQELTAALAAAPPDWTRRPDALVSLALTEQKQKAYDACVQLAEQHLDETGNAAAATDFIVNVSPCTEAIAKTDAPRIAKLREREAVRLGKLVDDPAAPLSVDDRSDAMANLRELDDLLGKHDDAKAVAQRQKKLLDDAAAKAPTPLAAMTYNWPRAEVYTYLGVPLELVPALEKSAKDLPTEYDPRARLGWIYLQAGKLDEAARWTDQALALVYGPRKARLLAQRAEIANKQHDVARETQLRKDLVTLWETMPAGQANPEALAKAKEQLAALQTAAK